MKSKLRGNQCTKCEKTHEQCAMSNCAKSDVSIYVCRMFGTLPAQLIRRKRT